MSEFGDLTRFSGVFPAVPTAFHDNGDINETANRAILEDNIAHGVHGFWNCGGTGEGAILDDQQRLTMARIVGEVCKDRVRSIMHVGSATTASSVKAARAARESGCDAVCCVPPVIYTPNLSALIEHYQRVADAAGELPFFAYNLPQMCHYEITTDMMEKIQRAVPQLVGLKHSAPSFAQVAVFAAMGLRVFTGDGYLALPALTNGAIGVVDSPPALAPWTYVELYDAFRRGDLATAMERQRDTQAITALARSNLSFQHNAKLILSERIGIDCGAPLPPVNRLDAAGAETLLARATELGLTTSRVAT